MFHGHGVRFGVLMRNQLTVILIRKVKFSYIARDEHEAVKAHLIIVPNLHLNPRMPEEVGLR